MRLCLLLPVLSLHFLSLSHALSPSPALGAGAWRAPSALTLAAVALALAGPAAANSGAAVVLDAAEGVWDDEPLSAPSPLAAEPAPVVPPAPAPQRPSEGPLLRLERLARKRFLKQDDAHIDALRRSPFDTLHPALAIVGDPEKGVFEERVRRGEGWVLLVAGEQDARSLFALSLFNRSLSLLHTPPSLLAPLSALSAEDDAEERLRISEESALARLWEREGVRERALRWTTGVVRFEHETRLAWRWWIWRVPLLVFLTPSSSGAGLSFRYLSLAWSAPPSPLELLELMGTPNAWLALPAWDGLDGEQEGAWYARWLGVVFERVNPVLDRVPGWAMTALSATLASFLVKWLHRPSPGSQPTGAPSARKAKTQGTKAPAKQGSAGSAAASAARSAARSTSPSVAPPSAPPSATPAAPPPTVPSNAVPFKLSRAQLEALASAAARGRREQPMEEAGDGPAAEERGAREAQERAAAGEEGR